MQPFKKPSIIRKLVDIICDFLLLKKPPFLDSQEYCTAPNVIQDLVVCAAQNKVQEIEETFPVKQFSTNNKSLAYNGVCILAPLPSKKQILALGCDGQMTFCCQNDLSDCLKYKAAIIPSIGSAVLDKNEKLLIIGGSRGDIMQYDLESNTAISTVAAHAKQINSILLSPDQEYFVSTSNDHLVKLWKTAKNECKAIFQGHIKSSKDAFITANNGAVVSASYDGCVKIWDTATLKEISSLQIVPDETLSCMKTIDDKGDFFACATGDNYIRLWDVRHKKEIKLFKGHSSGVTTLVSDGKLQYLLSGSWNTQIKLWDLRKPQCLAILIGHEQWIQSLATYNDFTKVVSGSRDLSIKLWDIGAVLAAHKMRNEISTQLDAITQKQKAVAMVAEALRTIDVVQAPTLQSNQ
jgi:WD40 repeat protein